ncbi:MAG: TRAP transporter substrate-binding protein [Planctomycetota bacterium]|jgi:TRAP-type C4-dicarboxylate transport system substrate-binding protein|nr:TRAP transporter substrate-binding protein [Planctomycetota bacterium]
MKRQSFALSLLISLVLFLPALPARSGETITLVGGTMLPEDHVFFMACKKFRELLLDYYKGPAKLEVDLHHSGTLGTEKDSIEYMIQGTAIDFYVISPAWFATWDKTLPFIDAPFLFRNVEHWEKCIAAGVLEPTEKQMVAKGVRLLGHGGGGVRSIISNKPAYTVKDFPNIRMRVQGSPLHQKAFAATGLVATPMDYMEVYNAIKTGVLDALENEPVGLEGMKFYEVAPYYILTQHQITTRQLAMSEQKFQSLPKDLQEAVLRAGKDAAAYHRKTEVALGEEVIKRLTDRFGLKPIAFDNAEMRRMAMPAVEAYAAEVGATDLLRAIEAIN